MSMVHILTLVTGEYSDTCRTVVGAYLNEKQALLRKQQLEELAELYEIDPATTRWRISQGGDYVPEGAEEGFAQLAGLDGVYISYNGLSVFMESIPLNG